MLVAQPQVRVKLSEVLAPAFFNVHNYIKNGTYSDYYLKGGRGSCKSSTPSIEIIHGMMADPNANAMCVMKVGTSIETGVFNQIQWAIDMLGVTAYWKSNKNNHSFTYIPTGQRIYCRGCDDASKFKSVKLVRGYFKYQWFEELDAFDGIAEIRKVQQSLTRAGLTKAIRFYSYNPPKTIDHWVNRFILDLQKDINDGKVTNAIVHHSTYLTVPKEWLGQQFIDDAEQLKRTKPKEYAHEYLGEITGTGGQVFANVESLNITQEKLDTFGYIYRGLDWGFAVDPTTMQVVYYDRAKKDLYIYDEIYDYQITYDMLATKIKQHNPNNMLVRADSAEPRSNSEMQQRGINIYGVKKGPGSVEHGIKWLQSLNHIYIDQLKCPNAYREFIGYEYEQTKDGNFKSSYPDKNNHAIDAVRYALEDIILSGAGGKINVVR